MLITLNFNSLIKITYNPFQSVKSALVYSKNMFYYLLFIYLIFNLLVFKKIIFFIKKKKSSLFSYITTPQTSKRTLAQLNFIKYASFIKIYLKVSLVSINAFWYYYSFLIKTFRKFSSILLYNNKISLEGKILLESVCYFF
jgi:hypothetical protein